MAQSYPIWIDINSCIYKKSKSYGIKNYGEQNIYIGSSKSNSHHFAKILITKSGTPEGEIIFKLSVDDNIIKTALFNDKNGRATDIISINDIPIKQAKIEYEYEIQGNYGQSYERLTTEENMNEAKIQLKCYNDNEPEYPHRIKKIKVSS